MSIRAAAISMRGMLLHRPWGATLLGAGLIACSAFVQTAIAMPVTVDFDTLPDGGLTNDGMLLTDQYGVWASFETPPGEIAGAAVRQCGLGASPICSEAYSGERVAAPLLSSEFGFYPISITFPEAQSSVSVYVRMMPDESTGTVHLQLLDDAGNTRGSVTMGVSSSAWTRLDALVLEPCNPPDPLPLCLRKRATRAVISATGQYNHLLIDDLTLDVSAPPPPPDEEPPQVAITAPQAEATITSVRVDVHVHASDNVQVASLRYSLVDSGEPVANGVLCGPGGDPCPPSLQIDVQQTLGLPNVSSYYTLTVTACDPSLNCNSDAVSFTVDLPEAPPPVFAFGLEVNQAVANRVLDFNFQPGIVRTDGDFVLAKPLLLRIYAAAGTRDRQDFGGPVHVRFFHADGRVTERSLLPNAGTGPITAPVYPLNSASQLQLMWDMRADLSRTLNYVIPGAWLTDVTKLGVTLQDAAVFGRAVSGELQIPTRDPIKLGLHIVRLRTAGTPNLPSDSAIDSGVLGYLRQAYPISEVQVLSRRSRYLASLMRESFACDLADLDPCSCALRNMEIYQFQTREQEHLLAQHNVAVKTLGVLSGCFPSATSRVICGCAYLGGSKALAVAAGDTAAQELGHDFGLIHASNSHGESRGGSAETTWPYEHGTIGPSNFGIVFSETVPHDATNPGQWALTLVDPCPGQPLLSQRFPTCSLADDTGGSPAGLETHDFMSYGASSTGLGPLITLGNRWISDITSNRLYSQISAVIDNRAQDEPGPYQLADSVMLQAVVDRDDGGPEVLLPLLRVPMPRADVERKRPGAYELELYDEQGTSVLVRSADPWEVTGSGDRHYHLISERLPDVGDVARAVVRRGTEVVVDQQASQGRPSVQVLSPNGGEIIPDGELRIAWAADDPDGDPMEFVVQYSPDGGADWESVLLTDSTQPGEAIINAGDLTPGDASLMRVVASDGLNTAVDVSDCPFVVGSSSQPAGCPLTVDVDLKHCPNVTPRRGRRRLPVVIIGDPSFDVTRVDPSSLELAGVPASARGRGARRRVKAKVKDVARMESPRFAIGVEPSECASREKDGVLDLAVVFNGRKVMRAIQDALGRKPDAGEAVRVTLTGKLYEEFGGVFALGEASLVIKPPKHLNRLSDTARQR